ncbi:type II toxin-antitoxin system RelE/ParE family toxin [bacterium]|nr:type II toxin-antitoxin system RelE/ParE family toxin [bacterium]
MNQLIILPPAAKYLKKIKDSTLKLKFQHTIDQIIENPFHGEKKTGDLSGVYGVDFHYNKTSYELAYRIIIKDNTYVIVILAGTRENFYEQLKRYM